jgi:hypothetical protein
MPIVRFGIINEDLKAAWNVSTDQINHVMHCVAGRTWKRGSVTFGHTVTNVSRASYRFPECTIIKHTSTTEKSNLALDIKARVLNSVSSLLNPFPTNSEYNSQPQLEVVDKHEQPRQASSQRVTRYFLKRYSIKVRSMGDSADDCIS